MKPTVEEVITLARHAGKILREGLNSKHQIHHKGPTDLVTDKDKLSEKYLIETILERYPDHSIVSEESGAVNGQHIQRWYIDPLDGTINYAHGLPLFSVSLAFANEQGMQIGVVYDPMMDECFWAERGGGAFLNGKPIQVSETQQLIDALLCTGFPYNMNSVENNLEYHNRFSLCSQGVRRLGSAALDLCYVACGRLDGFWETRLQPWDCAAGALIALEAGAKVSDMAGSADFFHAPYAVLAATPAIHNQMLAVIAKA